MKKVYIITYECSYSDGSYNSGVSYVYSDYEKALKMLEKIKQDEIQEYDINGIDIKDSIIDYKDSFVVDRCDDVDKFSIIEMNVE